MESESGGASAVRFILVLIVIPVRSKIRMNCITALLIGRKRRIRYHRGRPLINGVIGVRYDSSKRVIKLE